MKVITEIKSRRQSAEDYLVTKRASWDMYERLYHNKNKGGDDISSDVFDPKLSTLTLERSYRVMSQLPTGKVKAISKNDIGSSLLMNLIIDKYINPKANAQFDLLTKFRMMDTYSNIYGNFFALVDWDVKKNGYVGPDLWLLNIRDVFPQVGSVSLEDSDYVIIRSWKPLSYFEQIAKRKDKEFKNLTEIITQLKDKTDSKQARDGRSKSQREEFEYPKGDAAKHSGYFEVLSQYEGDRWVDYCVDADLEFRDVENPHENGELPVICKYSIPLLDDVMGMGDFERGASMQNTINSAWSLYLDAVKMSIFPPVAINQDAVASPSSLNYIPAAKWLFRTGQSPVNGMISPIQLTPRGIETFNNTYQIANGSLLNLFSTTDTTVTKDVEAGYGKTPQALTMQQQRENSRDSADRFYMEQFLRQFYTKSVNLISKKQSSAITLRLFEEEVKELARSYPEIADMYDEKTGKLSIDKSKTGSVTYDYEIESGSTYALDQKSQLDNIQQYIALYLEKQGPQGNLLKQALKEEGFEFKFGELFKKGITNSGIQDWDKILVEMTPEEKQNDMLDQQAQQFQMALQQVTGSGISNTPPDMQAAQQDTQQLPDMGQDPQGSTGMI